MVLITLSFLLTFLPELSARVLVRKAQQPKEVEKKFDSHWTRQKELELFGWDWVKIMGHECDCNFCTRQLAQHETSLLPETRKVLGTSENTKCVTRGGFRFVVPAQMPDNATSVVDYDLEMRAQRVMFNWYDPVTGEEFGYRTYSIAPYASWRRAEDYVRYGKALGTKSTGPK